MIQSVLFDIDNTLIMFDEVRLFNAYIPKITAVFMDLFSKEEFIERLISASRKMLMNQGQMSNAEYYLCHFMQGIDMPRLAIWNRFLEFYKTEFDQFESLVTPVDSAVSLIGRLKQHDIKLVAASHPIWPEMVQEQRLTWAGLDPSVFDYITHIENTSSCKPMAEYYLNICKSIEIAPEHCLMVGNDPVNDMIAGTIGMKTYLTTDASEKGFEAYTMSEEIRNEVQENIPEPDFTGKLEGVFKIVVGS